MIRVTNPFINAISLSLTTSRNSPSKLYEVSLSGGGDSTSAFPFRGSKWGSGVEKGANGNFVISEYIDNSIYLDRNNIVLYRRGMPFTTLRVTATVTVPRMSVKATGVGVTINFKDQEMPITVERTQTDDKNENILGSEDWADNPCSASAVRYSANKALNLIGAPEAGDFLVSYEGQYRSVLSSIYADVGYSYWWNFASAGIVKVDSESSVPPEAPAESCDILSYSQGQTLDGSRSHTSISYSRGRTEQIRSASLSRKNFGWFRVPAIRGLIWPTFREIMDQATGVWTQYQAIIGNEPLFRLGIVAAGSITKDFLDFGIGESGSARFKQWKNDVGWDDSLSGCDNWDQILGIPDIDVDVMTNQVIDSPVSICGGGELYLVKPAPPIPTRTTAMEIYYPHRAISFEGISAKGFQSTLSIINYSKSYTPHAQARGANPCAQDAEQLLGWYRTGHWRGVSVYSPDDAEEGITDNSNFWFSLAAKDALSGTLVDISLKAWTTWEKVMNPGLDTKYPPRGTIHYLEKYGYKLVLIRAPKRKFIFRYGRGVNCNDLSEVSGYRDPNDLSNDPLPKIDYPKFKSVCRSPIEDIQEQDQETLEDPLINAKNVKPGLLSAVGDAIRISIGGYTKKIVMPSLYDYIVTWETQVSYDIRAKLYFRDTNPIENVNIGNLSGDGVSAHTVSVTDVTPPGDGSPIFVPQSHDGGGPLKYLNVKALNFCCPINGSLESLSANASSEGINVSYNYRQLPKITPKMQIFPAQKNPGGGFVLV